MIVVMVTCVGSGIGQSVVDALNLVKGNKVIGCDGNPNVYARSYCDEFFVVPSIFSDGYLDHIIELCVRNNVDILVPGHDHELVLFSECYHKFRDRGVEVLVSEQDLILISRDKKIWHDHFSAQGCNVVPTLTVEEFINSPNLGYFPAIIKPAGGSASQDISIAHTLSDLDGLNYAHIIQPYLLPKKSDENFNAIKAALINGKFVQASEISVQLVFSKNSDFEALFISKNTLKNGVPVFIDTIDPETFEYTQDIMRFVPILKRERVRGPVNIQGRLTEDGLYFFEMNMRFTGITGNRALLGFNEVEFLVRNFLALPSNIGRYSLSKVGVRQVACTTIPKHIEEKNNAENRETLTLLGGGSNLGAAFVDKFVDKFDTIYVVARLESKSKHEELFRAYDNVKVVSVEDVGFEQILASTDSLINFVSALAYENDAAKFDAIRYIHNSVQKVAKARIPKVINISSQSVYPQDVNESKCELHKTVSHSVYSFQKLIMEDFFLSIKDRTPSAKVASLRLSRVIDPASEKQSGFFGEVVRKLRVGDVIEVPNPGNNTNLIHIEDAVSAIGFILSAMAKESVPEVINVGGENIGIGAYVELARLLVGNDMAKIKSGEYAEIISSSMLDCSLIQGMGWAPRYGIKDIVEEML